MKFTLIASLFLVSVVQAVPLKKRGTGVEISVQSQDNFCSYLPPSPGRGVAETEDDGVPFCTTARDYAASFPEGFIRSAHFLSTPNYVQVTGKIDHTVYNIPTEDGGGQYDQKVNTILCLLVG